MVSRMRPSRGDRASATTTRYVGCFVLPTRIKRIFTAIRNCSPGRVEVDQPSETGLTRKTRQAGKGQTLEIGRVGTASPSSAPFPRRLGHGAHELVDRLELLQ